MILPEPRWAFEDGGPLQRWYGHVHLLDDAVVGTWFCCDRQTGTRRWRRRRYVRPIDVVGVAEGVIVARGDPGGCYGIDLGTGRLRWVSHRDGLWGRLVRALDFVPLLDNECADMPNAVRDGEVCCRSGRVLAAATGRLIRRLPHDAVRLQTWDMSDAERLYHALGRIVGDWEPPPPPDWHLVAVEPRRFITHRPAGLAGEVGRSRETPLAKLFGLDDRGEAVWTFDGADTGYHFDPCFYGYRYARPWVYLLAAEKPLTAPIRPGNPRVVREQASRRHVLTLDARTGVVVQDLTLDGEWRSLRIEDVDARGVLLSAENRRLMLMARAS